MSGVGIADGAQPCATSPSPSPSSPQLPPVESDRPTDRGARQKGERKEGAALALSAPCSLPTIRHPLRRPVFTPTTRGIRDRNRRERKSLARELAKQRVRGRERRDRDTIERWGTLRGAKRKMFLMPPLILLRDGTSNVDTLDRRTNGRGDQWVLGLGPFLLLIGATLIVTRRRRHHSTTITRLGSKITYLQNIQKVCFQLSAQRTARAVYSRLLIPRHR